MCSCKASTVCPGKALNLSERQNETQIAKPFFSKNTYIKKKWFSNSGKQNNVSVLMLLKSPLTTSTQLNAEFRVPPPADTFFTKTQMGGHHVP